MISDELDVQSRNALLAKGHCITIPFSKNRELYGETALWLWTHFGPRDVLWYSSTGPDHVAYYFDTFEKAFEFKMRFV